MWSIARVDFSPTEIVRPWCQQGLFLHGYRANLGWQLQLKMKSVSDRIRRVRGQQHQRSGERFIRKPRQP